MRHALVTPILKKPSLDHDQPKNYRPVSNLSFLSKVIERVVAHQLGKYLDDNKLHHPFQSAYRPRHSVETALTRVHNDIMRSLDQQHGVILVLLDLSAAFDTVDHELLLSRLQTRFGIQGNVLQWLRSYLTDRQQEVCVAGGKSNPRALHCGVPQGSVLGPILFTCYISPLSDISSKWLLNTHQYADDSELYVSFKLSEQTSAETSLTSTQGCIQDIRLWMQQNKLKLNDEKTELLLISSPRLQHKISFSSVKVGESEVIANDKAANLGFTFDNIMCMEQHVSKICSTCFYHLRNISAIRNCLTKEATERLIHAFISSRLDNCNGLLYELPSSLLTKLQRVQNTAARIIARRPKHHSITAILKELHWLPVKQRIKFKIVTTTWKALHGLAPSYIEELLTPYTPSRELRSSHGKNLVIPKCNNNYGKRAFSCAAPKLWNSLPTSLKDIDCFVTFKSKLKTLYFREAYSE